MRGAVSHFTNDITIYKRSEKKKYGFSFVYLIRTFESFLEAQYGYVDLYLWWKIWLRYSFATLSRSSVRYSACSVASRRREIGGVRRKVSVYFVVWSVSVTRSPASW